VASQWDDHVTLEVCLPNIERIRKVGLEQWLEEQEKRRAMLDDLLANYDEGGPSFLLRSYKK